MNIGLISSLSIYSGRRRVRLPDHAVPQGSTSEDGWRSPPLRADEESTVHLSPADTPTDGHKVSADRVTSRFGGDFLVVDADKVQYIDVSPKQMVGGLGGSDSVPRT